MEVPRNSPGYQESIRLLGNSSGGPGKSQELSRRSQGGPRKVLGASQEVINVFLGGYWQKLQESQKVTKGIKCIIDHRIEHPVC